MCWNINRYCAGCRLNRKHPVLSVMRASTKVESMLCNITAVSYTHLDVYKRQIYVWGLHNEVYHPHEYTSQLTAALHDLAKTEDPDRYTVSVNGYGHMEHPVNLNADIQGMNRYFGWYEKKIQDIDAWVEGLEEKYPYEKLMLSEYGADANIYHQTEYLGQSLNWTKPYYPETFQTKTHEYQWSVIARHPYICLLYTSCMLRLNMNWKELCHKQMLI